MSKNEPESTINEIPFDSSNLTEYLRIRPVQFAKICGVSKNAVSIWIKNGRITLLPDGTLNPQKAASELIANSDAKKLRTKLFKNLVDDVEGYKKTINALKDELATCHKRIANLDDLTNEAEEFEGLLQNKLKTSLAEILESIENGTYGETIDSLFAGVWERMAADHRARNPEKYIDL